MYSIIRRYQKASQISLSSPVICSSLPSAVNTKGKYYTYSPK